MLQLKTNPQTPIPANIVARITHKPVRITKRRDYVLLGNDKNSGRGYAAILSPEAETNFKSPTVLCANEQLELLNDGDIVSIDKDGMVNVLYENNSTHNTLLVTERCNCSCIMCPQFIDNHGEDRTPLNLRIISLIDREPQSLGITGGEPTLLDDGLIDIIRACKEKLPRTKLMLLTNGIKFDDFEYVRKLMLVRHPDLTIDIPLYADTDSEHNRIIGAKGFYRTINGFHNLIRFNQRIGIRVVMHKLTYERLPQLAEFLYHNFPFVFHVAFMQMETINLARDNLDRLWIDPYDYNEQLEEAVFYLHRRGMNVSIYNAQLCVLPKTLWPFARKSISSWKNIYLHHCEPCNRKNECAGLFESSKDIYSSHIKPFTRYKAVPKTPSGSEPSKILLRFIDDIATIKPYPILDAPCGFGRHSLLFAEKGCKVISVDINQKALDYVYGQRSTHESDNLIIRNLDLEQDRWDFESGSVGAVINVHYYSDKLLDHFMDCLTPGGFLYIETPGGQGRNYIQLPVGGTVRTKLLPFFNILYYEEKAVGPPGSARVSLRVFAQKHGFS